MRESCDGVVVDSERITAELETLAGFSETPSPAVTRIVFTEPDRQARSWLKSLFREAKLQIREDAVGNIFARWVGDDLKAAAVATGSHIDAIPNAGRYDGTVGVIGALEAIRALQRSGFRPKRSIELLLFTSEEPTRCGIGCLGSRLLSGALSPELAEHLTDKDGHSLDEARTAAGFEGLLGRVPIAKHHYAAFVELHIEQGPMLAQSGVPIGIVTDIAAPASLRIQIEGQGGHAGAVLMPGRRDALLGAAELALFVEKAARESGAIDTVATTGVCEVFPGAVNSIPSRVKLEIDIRDIDVMRRDRVVQQILEICELVAEKRQLAIAPTVLNADPPAQCDSTILAALEEACLTSELPFQKMVSRAYHDSLFMARVAPTAMLFIPCRDGISHRPDEYTSPHQIATGTLVLARTLKHLASV